MNDDDKKLPAIQKRLLGAAVEIDQDDPLEIVYQHSLFCQVALPRSRPEGRVFERSYRYGSISLEAGKLWDGTRWIEQPLPAGPKPRLALCHLNSEAVKTRCPVVEVDRSARKFMERLGLNTDGGSTYNLFKREMKALAACRMTLGFGGTDHPVTVDAKPIRRFEAWLAHEKGQPTFWPGTIELSREYFDSLLEHAVPLDPRAVSALAHSAMALDAYSFLARRLYTLEKPVKVTWRQFHAQFGHEFKDWRNFKQEFIHSLRAALTVYPSAKVEEIRGGLLLRPSLPPVHAESVAVSHGLADQVRARLPAPPPIKNLAPATVERFRKLYPRIEPHACKDDFDAWLEAKEPPRHYDRAFLGFAKKWVKGKV
ncbi:MAG TPA: replication protein [Candidatus Competibacteraceae bacterium]|nr:replication protein [Candidatus Competibacteraceae bacterium]